MRFPIARAGLPMAGQLSASLVLLSITDQRPEAFAFSRRIRRRLVRGVEIG
jgi:hypothetical protein